MLATTFPTSIKERLTLAIRSQLIRGAYSFRFVQARSKFSLADMADITISDVGKVSREELAGHILSGPSGLAIIDVRDSDFIGGHIIGCQNVPTNTFDYRMPELVRTLKDKDTVVFHCALSQQRGPQSALRYLRERERLNKHLQGQDEQAEGKTKQQVLILEGGFVKWQEKFGEDERLTEGYRKDVWQDGY